MKVDIMGSIKSDAALFGDAFADRDDIEVGKNTGSNVILGNNFFFSER